MTDVQLFFDADLTPVNQRNSVYTWDDFRAAGGEVNWGLAGTGTPATSLSNLFGSSHPGVNSLVTSNASGDTAYIQLVDFYEDVTQTIEWIFRLSASTAMALRIGLTDNAPSPSSAVFVEYDTSLGDTALGLTKYIGGVRTVGATLPLTAGHWYRMNWSRTGSGAGDITLNDLTAATSASYHVTGVLAAAEWSAAAFIKTLSAATRNVLIDWFLGTLSGMIR